jgi:hypothetical protein
MLEVLSAIAGTEGVTTISRPREGVWPERLHTLQLLEQGGYLKRENLLDDRPNGNACVTYRLIEEGRWLLAQRSNNRPRAHSMVSSFRGRQH